MANNNTITVVAHPQYNNDQIELIQQTGLERDWLESEFAALPAVNGKKAQAWVEFIGSCAK